MDYLLAFPALIHPDNIFPLCLGFIISLISSRKLSLICPLPFRRSGQACPQGSRCPRHPCATALDMVLELSATSLTSTRQESPEHSGRLDISPEAQWGLQNLAHDGAHSRWSVGFWPLVSQIPVMSVLGGAAAGRF